MLKIHLNIRFIFASFVFLLSLIILWRSYFVLFANERAVYWQFGVDQLAKIVKDNPDQHFIIDQARRQPIHANLLFYLKYPPQVYHRETDQNVRSSYYLDEPSNDNYSFGNVELRDINWETDIKPNFVLVGDEYAISDGQAVDHKLKKVFEIKSPVNEMLYEGYSVSERSE